MIRAGFALLLALSFCAAAAAQRGPSRDEAAAYTGLHAAVWQGDAAQVEKLISRKADLQAVDRNGRTALHVAAFASHEHLIPILVKAGSDPNRLENDRYDMVTIAAVADDIPVLKAALAAGNKATNVTSIYDGTALIAAAHLGHHESVDLLIKAGAPLDHINNLGWTALIEAVILGDGGPAHQETARLLLAAGADKSIADRDGVTPLQHAERRGYGEMVALLR